MTDTQKLDEIRSASVIEATEYEKWSKVALAVTAVCELGGGIAVLLLMDWSDPTHRLIFAATLLVYLTLAMFHCTIALWRQAGEQRILQAVQLLESTVSDLAGQVDGMASPANDDRVTDARDSP